MNTKLTLESVLQIASDYKKKFNLSGVLSEGNKIRFYSDFDNVNGPVWLVVVSVSPNDFYVENEYTIIVSDKEAVVKYVIDPNGHVFMPHEITEEEESDDNGDIED